jgi:CheY-like chemotaxis protein/HAMP domain-containing protein/GAF domain-containing protein
VSMPAQTEDLDLKELLKVLISVRDGNFNERMPIDKIGLAGKICDTLNEIIDLNQRVTSEFERVSNLVGKEGMVTERASIPTAQGSWRDCVNSVNSLVFDMVQPNAETARVIRAVARGDLSQTIELGIAGRPLKGEFLQTATIVNTMVAQLNSFASEVTRVAREVGTEGKLGGQADVRGVAGTWKDLTDNVNSMAGNLTAQMRNIAEVTTAVANGDLSKKITVDVKGEILDLKNTINVMVDQLNSFASEVTRVAREVGTEGKLGGQADVRGVAGVWKDLTDNVNSMAGNLTAQVRNIAEVTTAVANGDLSKKITVDVKGEILDLKNTINVMVDQLNSFASEVTRVAREVGTEGKLGGQADVRGVAGTWKDLTDNVNSMAGNLTAQVRNIAEVTTAVANGDLSKKITVDAKGEILDLKNTINVMVDQLNSFAAEVTRVAREVGTEGRLGGQADVRGVAGVWKDLTDNVNSMAGNLTAQVRNIAKVVTAVANGDLKQNLALEAKGEIATLADTINEMINTLATFADQVTTVAREVGIEGKLGGQASVPSAAGTWRHLTDNVNQLAANLTTQVRAIAEVATAVTKGDLTRSITVGAQGEVAELKDNINQMIANLRETTQKNNEQDWLKTNLAKFTRMLQGQRHLESVSKQILSELAPLVSAQHGVFFIVNGSETDAPLLKLLSSYAYRERKGLSNQFQLGEGLVGQCALEKERILLSEVPQDYIRISSGLGEASPLNVVALPVLFEGQVTAVIELASFYRFSEIHLTFLDQLTESIGIVLNTIAANMRTEQLLKQSQSLAEELQSQQRELTETNRRLEQQARSLQASEDLLRSQQEELRQTNDELEEKARLLALQNSEVERKNHEIEQAKQALEEKAEQLALTSKYKSEFLANTPLNSMLILSRLLADNSEGNLSMKQVEFAQTVYMSGTELLALINDILDLAKIESGTMSADVEEVLLTDLARNMERSFEQVAHDKGLQFQVQLVPGLPYAVTTDPRRMQQILRNLLSNAFKFTERGRVTLRVEQIASKGMNFDRATLNNTSHVLAFSVTDTGIGIPADKQKIIFEAFQQADGTTSRKYGGTGLGLSISREIAGLLGGEIRLTSTPGMGSTFTLYLPPSLPSPSQRTQYLEETTRLQQSLIRSAGGFRKTDTGQRAVVNQPTGEAPHDITDDRLSIQPGDTVLLIVEDDANFAQMLLNTAREAGFKGIVTSQAVSAMTLVREFKPAAITLDIMLPITDGWTLLNWLKSDASTRDIPVHIISISTDVERGLNSGVVSVLKKPITGEDLADALRSIRQAVEAPLHNVLLIEDNEVQRKSIIAMLRDQSIQVTDVNSGLAAINAIRTQKFDLLIIDFELPDMTGLELIARIEALNGFWEHPVIVYMSKNMSEAEEAELRRLSKTILIKNVRTLESMLDTTTKFLTSIRAVRPDNRTKTGEFAPINGSKDVLSNSRILIIDDDMRNIFATTSVLERYGVEVVFAESGRDGINILTHNPQIDAVLMDIMMPEMDGYEAIRAIRAMPQFAALPIVALTAKAMKGDREKCLEAGASDYVTKPMDTEQLLMILRRLLQQPRMHR